MRAAKIYVNKIPAGMLTENNDGSFTFRYNDDYFANPVYSSISLTLPKTQREYRSETLFPFFANMLSEGVNRRVQSRKFKIDEEDGFGLLMATAQNDTIGAVMTLGKMIGISDVQFQKIMKDFLTSQPLVYELAERSFLDERLKRMYARVYEERLNGLKGTSAS